MILYFLICHKGKQNGTASPRGPKEIYYIVFGILFFTLISLSSSKRAKKEFRQAEPAELYGNTMYHLQFLFLPADIFPLKSCRYQVASD